jgi:hypothetical protein
MHLWSDGDGMLRCSRLAHKLGFLARLSPEQSLRACRVLGCRLVSPRCQILMEDDTPEAMYMVIAGSVQFSSSTRPGIVEFLVSVGALDKPVPMTYAC